MLGHRNHLWTSGEPHGVFTATGWGVPHQYGWTKENRESFHNRPLSVAFACADPCAVSTTRWIKPWMKSYSSTSPKEYDQDSKRKKPLQYTVLLEGRRENFTALQLTQTALPELLSTPGQAVGCRGCGLEVTPRVTAETHSCHAPVEINHAKTKRAALALTCIAIFGFFFFLFSLSLSLGLKHTLTMWNDSFLISSYRCTGTCNNSRVSWHNCNTVS